MPAPSINLSSDEVDDLVYFSRTGDLPSLKESIESLIIQHKSCAPSSLLIAAVDIDSDGLGSGSCLLHYPAANGNLEVVEYLLSLARSNDFMTSTTVPMPATSSLSSSSPSPSPSPSPGWQFINHQNVSGNTPLHWAGMNGHLEVVKALIKAGADPEIVNGAGRDAVVESEWSSKDGAEECAVWILRECGALEKGVGEDVAGGGGSGDAGDLEGVVEGVKEGAGVQENDVRKGSGSLPS